MPKIDKLESFNLDRNPFFELTSDSEHFQKLFVGRENEMFEINIILDFYRSGTRQNTILVGESGVGKTTILNNIMIEIEGKDFQYLYFPYFI